MKESHLKTLQYLTGIGLVIVVGLHLYISHLKGGDPTSWDSVSDRAASVGWFITYILILLFGIYHGMHAIRGLILEFSLPDRSVKMLNLAMIVLGLAVFGYAVYIPIQAY
jgi:succinate dehydrogenase hydrophobic anchor subunit